MLLFQSRSVPSTLPPSHGNMGLKQPAHEHFSGLLCLAYERSALYIGMLNHRATGHSNACALGTSGLSQAPEDSGHVVVHPKPAGR